MKGPQHCFNSDHSSRPGGVMPATPRVAMNSAIRPLPELEDSSRRVAAGSDSSLTTDTLYAVEEVRRMRGGSQAHLMRCSDGNYDVVKFQDNPQHRRVLVNELLGTRLAALIGLPTTAGALIQEDPEPNPASAHLPQ